MQSSLKLEPCTAAGGVCGHHGTGFPMKHLSRRHCHKQRFQPCCAHQQQRRFMTALRWRAHLRHLVLSVGNDGPLGSGGEFSQRLCLRGGLPAGEVAKGRRGCYRPTRSCASCKSCVLPFRLCLSVFRGGRPTDLSLAGGVGAHSDNNSCFCGGVAAACVQRALAVPAVMYPYLCSG